jgi:hypothetical protein
MNHGDVAASVHVNDKKTDDERFFCRSGVGRGRSGWYFRAREGIFGPYGSLVDAHQELRDLIGTQPDRQIERLRRLGLDLNRT